MTTATTGEPTPRLPQLERRSQLLDVAESLFVERGFSTVTMEDIARAAGVSRPIPYRHFGSKEGVYLACVGRARDAYHAEMFDEVAQVQDPAGQLERGADVFFRILERDPGRWLLLFGSNSGLTGTWADELAALRFETIDVIAGLLRNAAPEIPPRRLEALAHAVSGIGERLGHWRLADPTIPRAELVAHFTDIAWHGLGAYAEAPELSMPAAGYT